jgi:hypothetical protein
MVTIGKRGVRSCVRGNEFTVHGSAHDGLSVTEFFEDR